MSKKNRITKNCIICGNSFEAKLSDSYYIKCCSTICGGKYKQQNFDNKLELRIGMPIKIWLIEHYTNQIWVYSQITKELHINTRTLMRYMRQFNIPIRNPSEAVRTQWIRNPKRHEDGLKIAVNGAIKRANHLRNNPQQAECNLIKELDKRNIKYQFQYPINSYILDFAFPDSKIDVELENPKRCGKNFNRLEKTRKRIKDLSTLGWITIQFSIHQDSITIADEIEILLNDRQNCTSTVNIL